MKRIVSVILIIAAAICLTTAAGAPGSSSDPLVTRSYVDDVFVPGLVEEAEDRAADALGSVYDSAAAQAGAVYESALLRLGTQGYTLSDSFVCIKLSAGDTVSMLTGGKFILISGSASVSVITGTLINISTGAEVSSGSQINLRERYFCAEDTSAVFTASSASVCMVDGYYSTTGTVGEITPAVRYTDVPAGTWYYEAVYYCTNIGLVEGVGNNKFAPGNELTMAGLVQLLFRMAGGNTTGSSPYWYSKAQNWAINAGIVTAEEFEAGKSEVVPREVFCRMFYACAAYTGKFNMEPRADITVATDYADIDEANRDAISWAVAMGLIKGTSTTELTIKPDGSFTRAMMCEMIMRYLESA